MADLEARSLRKALVDANRKIRAQRPPLATRANVSMREYVAATGSGRDRVRMYQFWFRTRGCTFDRAGQCSMCNYGIGPEIDHEGIVRSVRRRLSDVPEGASVYLSPSGSLFDDVEVPAELRDRLLHEVAARKPSIFAFESRPELYTPEKLRHVREVLPGTALIGQVGMESWDTEVRNLCHLKPTSQDAFVAAARMMNDHGYASIANITLGALGLSQGEAYADALASVRGARGAGFTTQMVFPLSAKSGTLLGWVAERGRWEPPSLWALIHLLADCVTGVAGTSDISISWFDPAIDDVVRIRPDGCAACREFVVGTLHRFREEPRYESLTPALTWTGCDCPARMRGEIARDDVAPGHRALLHEIVALWQAEQRLTLPIAGIGR